MMVARTGPMRRWLPLAIVVIAYVAIGAGAGLRATPDVDERLYHLPATLQFARQFPRFDLVHYPSASGPLLYVLLSVWVKLFGGSLIGLRIAVALLGLASILMVWKLLARDPVGTAAMTLALIVFDPYFAFRSFSLFTIIPALFFGLLALAAFEAYREGRHPRVALAGCAVALAAAVLIRQDYFSYTLGLVTYAGARALADRGRPSPAGRPVAWVAPLILATPLVPMLALFRLWGGSTPPTFARYFGGSPIHLLQLDFVPIFFGFWFWPLAIDHWRSLPRWLPFVAVLLGLHLLLGPLYSWAPGDPQTVMGTIARLFGELRVRGLPVPLLELIQALVWAVGLLSLAALVQDLLRPATFVALGHLALLSTIPLVYERYYLPLSTAAWLSAGPRMRTRWPYGLLLAQSLAISAAYFATHG